jgi:hypothetical protein
MATLKYARKVEQRINDLLAQGNVAAASNQLQNIARNDSGPGVTNVYNRMAATVQAATNYASQVQESQRQPTGGGGDGGGGGGGGGGAAPVTVAGVYQKRQGQFMITYERMSDGSEREIDRVRERSAGDDVEAMFTAAGLNQEFVSQLVGIIDGLYQGNVAPTQGQMLNAIYNSEPYKQRFSANEIIRQRLSGGKGRPGDRLLSPKEYIDLENTYRQIFQDAQMPTGFYDAPEDFNTLISNSISASELQSRVNVAGDALQKADPATLNSLSRYYNLTKGDLVAYLLDPAKAMPVLEGVSKRAENVNGLNSRVDLERMYEASKVGGSAERQGMNVDKSMSEEIVDLGKAGSADEAFAVAGAQDTDVRRLGRLYEQPLDFKDLVKESLTLTGGVESGRKRRKLASKERAAFSGQSALDRTSLRKMQDV